LPLAPGGDDHDLHPLFSLSSDAALEGARTSGLTVTLSSIECFSFSVALLRAFLPRSVSSLPLKESHDALFADLAMASPIFLIDHHKPWSMADSFLGRSRSSPCRPSSFHVREWSTAAASPIAPSLPLFAFFFIVRIHFCSKVSTPLLDLFLIEIPPKTKLCAFDSVMQPEEREDFRFPAQARLKAPALLRSALFPLCWSRMTSEMGHS